MRNDPDKIQPAKKQRYATIEPVPELTFRHNPTAISRFQAMRNVLFHCFLIGAMSTQAGRFAEAAERTHEFRLANGLQLLVQEDHRAPVVISQVWYKVGASYEHDGITGVSHALEHMMFKGTERHGPNEFSRIISDNGGEDNAFTGDDYTAYYQKLEKSRLPISFELEAERMHGLKLAEDEFAKERKVIMEERRLRTDDEPEAILYESALAAAFQISPYRHPVIGWMQDIELLTVPDLRTWYTQWYVPNNATVVVAGDVEPDAVRDLAEKYFGPLPRGAEPAVKRATEPVQAGSKRIVVRAPAQLPSVLLAYKVPALRSTDQNASLQHECYALEVLARVLGGGESSRLHRRLVRGTQIAAAVGAGYDLVARLDKLFTLEGTPAHGRDPAALESAILGEIQVLQNQPVAAKELERIKTQTIASHVYERDSLFAQAMQLGAYASLGLDWHLRDRYVEELKTVTAADVQNVARRYLQRDRLTVAILEPTAPSHSKH
jgi:zinc protease